MAGGVFRYTPRAMRGSVSGVVVSQSTRTIRDAGWISGTVLVVGSGVLRSRDGGQVAQLVEQRTENPCVGGSIPPLATTGCFRSVLRTRQRAPVTVSRLTRETAGN